MRDRKGFTIVELCIAMSLIGILTVISTSNLYGWLDHAAVVDFKRELFSMSNEARARAMASNRQHRILLDVTNDNMVLQRGNGLTGSTSWSNVGNLLEGARGSGIEEIVFDNGTTVSSSTVAFLFNPGGQVLAVDSSSAISTMEYAKIRLAAKNPSDRATVRIYGFTSKARMEDGWN